MTHDQLHDQTARAKSLCDELAKSLSEALGRGGPHKDGPITTKRVSRARRRAERLARQVTEILSAVNANQDDPAWGTAPEPFDSRRVPDWSAPAEP